MADAKNIAILVGSVAAAGTLGYMYGKGRIRLPNPPWSKNFSQVVEAFMTVGDPGGPAIDADVEAIYAELQDTEGWSAEYSLEVLQRMERMGYVEWEGTIVTLTPDAVRQHRARVENPTGFPMTGKLITKGPHEGQVMYRPKLPGRKQRPRIYMEPGEAGSLQERTESTVDARQETAGKEPRRKTKARAKVAKPKPKAEKKPKPKPRKKETAAERQLREQTESVRPARKTGGKKKPPPRVAGPKRKANPGPSTADLVRRLRF